MNEFMLRLPGILLSEFVWTFVSVIGSAVIAVLVLRLILGLSLGKILFEIEEDQNGGVGAAFFSVFTASGFLVGRMLQSPAVETSAAETALWGAVALIVILVIFVFFNWIILGMVSKRKGERVLQYIRREVVDENNTALMLMVGGMLVNITLIVGHITL
jgi:uncharacterized membrane protein YjfL (UPF0719 family)